MRLLVLTNNPSRASFRQRIRIYFDVLRTNGINPELAVLPKGSFARRKLFKRADDFDGVFLHKKCLNFFDALSLRRYHSKIIYDFDDAVMYSPRTPQSDRSSHFRLFRRTAKLAGLIIAGNAYLGEHAGRFNPNVRILPTGLDTKKYARKLQPESDGKVRLVWIGSKSTLKYLAEIKPALEEVGTRFDNVLLRIICDDFFDLQNIGVEKCPWSLQTQAENLAACHIGLAPLPDNRFTRGKCGFKALQYAAAGLPAIASPVGVNAEYVLDGITGYHASRISEWVEKISELVRNINLREKMGRHAAMNAEQYDTTVIGNKLVEIIKKNIVPS